MAAYSVLKRFLVGRPLGTHEEAHTRVPKIVALPVFASDAISSTAYATEEILHVLVPLAAMAAIDYLVPLSLVVFVVLAIVANSYRQTIHAYPSGGGAYIVSRENLGEYPALVAGGSLLVDYVLTVSVSVAAGVAAITSAIEPLRGHQVEIGLGFVALLTMANLRGLRESGSVFAPPTYGYVLVLGGLIVWGLAKSYFGDLGPLPVNEDHLHEFVEPGTALSGVTAFALMRAFSSGAVALTGIEAISNGVPAFRKPEAKNAATTLIWMAAILGTFFLGISVLAHRLAPTLSEDETILSILGKAVYGDGSVLYGALQFFTAAILVLAANTAFADFPRLASIIARDHYLPRQLANRGDRLVFSNGVVMLAAAAAALLVVFGGETTALIPLYAVGVFTSFTLSQSGMVVHHRREREPGWRRSLVFNAVGAVATFIVFLIVLISKFTIGAWVPAVVIPLIVVGFKAVKRHYDHVAGQLVLTPGPRTRPSRHVVVVPVGGVNEVTMRALDYARTIDPDRVIAVSVAVEPEHAEALRAAWRAHRLPMALKVIESPYRDLTDTLMDFLEELDEAERHPFITVVIAEFVLPHLWENALHNQSALVLKTRLLRRPRTAVTSVPFQIKPPEEDDEGAEPAPAP